MALKKIQLTADQIGELYSSHIVITGNESKNEEVTVEKPGFAIKGKNKKHFVWVVDEPGYPFLNDADFQFTGDVISACKMNMDDIALVNIANTHVSFAELTEQLQPKYLIISTQISDWIPVATVHYETEQVNGIQLYVTEPVSALRNDKVKKSKLWLALKQMLGL
ncbi:MAG: hypothetical protein QM725_08470 [Lacibacter sp.]